MSAPRITTIVGIACFCIAMVAVTTKSSSQDLKSSAPDVDLMDDDWIVLVVSTGHEFTLRLELRSSGRIDLLKGAREGFTTKKWETQFTEQVSKDDCLGTYQAAEKLLHGFKVADRATRPGIGRDEDGSYRVAIATRQASFHINFLNAERLRDKELTEDFNALLEVMQRANPINVGIARHPFKERAGRSK